jgi:hypothetical protein
MLYKVPLDPIMFYKLDNHSLNLRKFASDLLQNMAKVHNQLLFPSFYSKCGKSSYPLVILSCIQSFISTAIQTQLICASHTIYLCQMHYCSSFKLHVKWCLSFKFHVKFHNIGNKILTSIWTEKENSLQVLLIPRKNNKDTLLNYPHLMSTKIHLNLFTQVLLIWTKNNKVHPEGGSGWPAPSPAFLLKPAGGLVVGKAAAAGKRSTFLLEAATSINVVLWSTVAVTERSRLPSEARAVAGGLEGGGGSVHVYLSVKRQGSGGHARG